jgi:DNA gyrase subunit A
MMDPDERTNSVLIEEEMRNSYIDYSMSVIVARALPDIRDGLKPVHRRVLYGMLDLGLRPNSAYKKSARIVGEVLGKYHPHGDAAVYDAMVRMVQDFSLRYPLVDGQGNFGSIDGDSPAAMRYTEARLAQITEEVIKDIDKETVDFVPNFDESLKEPAVLPSLLPTLLINGASGIAVGMATNVPPHNLNEVVDALTALIHNPNLKSEAFRKFIQGPDFPTGGIIFGDDNIDAYFKTGRGKLTVRARVHLEDVKGMRQRIVVTEIPYQVNKISLIERIAGLVREKKIEGISEIRDESDREGMRIVFELRKEIDAKGVIRDLFQHSQMQVTFGVIMLALVNGEPKILSMKQMLEEFIKFRHEVVLRRTKFELDKAEKRAHILEGLKIALDNIDEIVVLIKKSRDVDTARQNLTKRFKLSEIQAQSILDMRLQRLTGLERKKIEDEYKEIIKLIERLKALLASKQLRMQLIKDELLALKEKYGDARRTQIVDESKKETTHELVDEEQVIVTISHAGILKKYTHAEYENNKEILRESQNNDFILHSFLACNSHHFLFFTNRGYCHNIRTSSIPFANASENGASFERLLRLNKDEKVVGILNMAKFEDNFISLVTAQGSVKRISSASFIKISDEGAVVISLKEKDVLVSSVMTDGNRDLIIATAEGSAIRFPEQEVRDMGLAAGGIKGITLSENDAVIGMVGVKSEKSTLLTLTSLGFGKRSALSEYGIVGRGGKGVYNFKISEKTGRVVDVLEVQENDQMLVITKKGRFKRQKAKFFKIMGRATHGIVVANVAKNDEVMHVFHSPDIIIS